MYTYKQNLEYSVEVNILIDDAHLICLMENTKHRWMDHNTVSSVQYVHLWLLNIFFITLNKNNTEPQVHKQVTKLAKVSEWVTH